MNIHEIKAGLGDKPKHLGTENSVKNQLRDAGLLQAVKGHDNQASILTSQFSSETSVAVRVYNNSLNSHLTINQHKANLPTPKTEESTENTTKTLFDFEEIAKNVLNFIGGAVRNAQGKGADEETLSNLFDQATSGVLKGIKMAKDDLSGMMNEEIENGINRSQNLIEQGIAKLKEEIFGTVLDSQLASSNSQLVSQSADYEKSQSDELQVVTKDGDKVKIVFENVEQFELNRRGREEQVQPITLDPAVISPLPSLDNPNDTDAQPSIQQLPIENIEAQPGIQPLPIETNEAHASNVGSEIRKENYEYFQASTLSFSVRGELDEDELRAIGKLVANANDLADEFFNGDVEKSFDQALKLGFDDQELTGFALQLIRQDKVPVIQTYESVAHFKDDITDTVREVKPVAHYLDKMLDLVEESKQKLQEGNSFDNLLNDLINQMGEVHTPDLIQALNRFHTFNQKLSDNLPASFQPEA
ncbi:MAG: hypothetical protein ACI8XG_000924 [Congregibacter sp.]|jgi:hypothetical protein